MKYLHLNFLGCRVYSKSLLAVWLLVMSGFGAGIASAADDVVVPNDRETMEGVNANCIPITGCLDADRYQQVYDDSQFNALLGMGLQYVTEIRFRPNGTDVVPGAPFTGGTFADVEINLSTTLNDPDSLSSTYDDNIGADEANAFRGPLTFSSSVTPPGPGPKDFDLVIPLQTPFFYDPTLGHLLFEWKNFSGENFSGFADAENIVSDSISRVQSASFPDDPEAPVGVPDTAGLMTQFTFVGADELSVTNALTPEEDDFLVVNLPQFFQQRANVTLAGRTSADFCVGEDPRETIKKGRARFKQRYLNVSEMSNTGSCGDLSDIDLRIAPWFRGYQGEFDEEIGVWFVVAIIQSDAEYLGPVEVDTFPESLIDFSVSNDPPACNTTLEFRELALGGAVAAFGDHPNTEGTRMIPETAFCNAGRNLSRRTTHVYPVRLDAKSNEERINVQWQLNGIEDTIAEARECAADDTVLDVMQSLVDAAQSAFAQGLFDGPMGAIAQLEQVARDAKFNSADFVPCPTDRNYVGNFMSRGLVAAFTIFDRFLHGESFVLYPVPGDLDVF